MEKLSVDNHGHEQFAFLENFLPHPLFVLVFGFEPHAVNGADAHLASTLVRHDEIDEGFYPVRCAPIANPLSCLGTSFEPHRFEHACSRATISGCERHAVEAPNRVLIRQRTAIPRMPLRPAHHRDQFDRDAIWILESKIWFVESRSRSFQVDLNLVEGDEFIPEEPKSPPCGAFGRVATGKNNQPGIGLAVDLSLVGPIRRFAVDHIEAPVIVPIAEVVGRVSWHPNSSAIA